MLAIDYDTEIEIETDKLEEIARILTDRDVDLLICGNETIRELNNRFRGKDNATDVLSFPLSELESGPETPLGSIAISVDMVVKKAEELGHSKEDELALLLVHGLLHLMGYDHETDDGEMRAMETKIIKKLALPESLTVRTN